MGRPAVKTITSAPTMVLALFIITIIVLAVFWFPTTPDDWNYVDWSDADKRRSLLSAHPTGRRLLDNAGGVDNLLSGIPAMPAVGTSVDSIGGGRRLLQEGEDDAETVPTDALPQDEQVDDDDDDARAENIARFRADPLGYDGPWIQEVMSPSVARHP